MRIDISVLAPGVRRGRSRAIGLVAIAGVVAGCASPAAVRFEELARALERAEQPRVATDEAAFLGDGALERAALIGAILDSNPTIGSARHAWRAALQRHPQVTSLDDPIAGYGAAPRSFGARGLDDAHVLDLTQALPFPGKLALRGEAALAEAEAARGNFEAVRLRLATMGSLLFDDHYFFERAIEINAEHIGLLESFKRIALARYEVGKASQQDPLQAEMEVARLLQRDLELRTRARLTRQQLNTLLHRSPGTVLPPAPAVLMPPPIPFAEVAAAPLTKAALEARPELDAAASQVRAREADVSAAHLEFLPDFTLVGNYNRRLPISENRAFIGLRINVPLQVRRRRALLEQARASLARAHSEQAELTDGVKLAVHSAFDEWEEARAIAVLFDTRLLPAARDRIVAARAGFETGRNGFLELIDAERDLRRVKLDREQTAAELSRRAARLLRAVGRTPGLPETNP